MHANLWTLFVVSLAGWINREQQRIIEFQNLQIEILRERLGDRRLRLTQNQRLRLAQAGFQLGSKLLRRITTIVAPDTILRWHRELIARKWDFSNRRTPGRPRIRQEIVALILRFARENPTWGYDRIQGALANVGQRISAATVANVLKAHGIEPAPKRRATGSWAAFLKSHWATLFALDFTTVEVWTRGGLVTYYILIVMHLKTRRIEIAGITTQPDAAWVVQVTCQLTNPLDGFLQDATHLILDRDTKFSPLRTYLTQHTDITPVLLPPRSPNLNAYVERVVRSLKSEVSVRRRTGDRDVEDWPGWRYLAGVGRSVAS